MHLKILSIIALLLCQQADICGSGLDRQLQMLGKAQQAQQPIVELSVIQEEETENCDTDTENHSEEGSEGAEEEGPGAQTKELASSTRLQILVLEYAILQQKYQDNPEDTALAPIIKKLSKDISGIVDDLDNAYPEIGFKREYVTTRVLLQIEELKQFISNHDHATQNSQAEKKRKQ